MIFDTHAHYDDEQFSLDGDALVASLPSAGIGRVVEVSASIDSPARSVAMAHKFPHVYAAVGIHPDDVGKLDEELFKNMAGFAKDERCVAVGEIGLDYYWDNAEHDVQKFWFMRQMELAREINKPIIIHSRDAAQDTYDYMKEAHAENIGGVVHCFSYSVEMAKLFLDMGFYIGIGGVLTYKNARKQKEVVEYCPMDRLVLETDCPYLSPVPNRGKRNSSLNLPYVVTEMAAIKGMTEEEVIRQTYENANRLYRLEK